jgi:hypothetical protein
VASQRGQARGAAEAQQQAAAQEQYAAPPPPAAQAAPAAAPTDSYAELMQLKQLLDAGALTQAEFDAQKQKLLSA